MTRVGWSLVATVAQMLQAEEREAALGDLAEAGESAFQGLAGILGLVLRRQASLWKSWRPWLAGFGLTVPNSLLLMGASVSVSQTFLKLTGHKVSDGGGLTALPDVVYLACQVFVLFACSWAGGFVAASVSRRTLWASGALCALPCLFCLATFRIESLSAVSLFLFLPAALQGARRGLATAPIKRNFAIPLALAITILMLPALSSGRSRSLSWALLWPAWYLVAVAPQSGNRAESALEPGERTAR